MMIETILFSLLVLVTVFIVPLYHAFSWGLVFWLFYGWFVLPVFPDLPHIAYLGAVGLTLFAGLFKNQNLHFEIPEDKQAAFLAETTIKPFAALLLGYIVKLIIS